MPKARSRIKGSDGQMSTAPEAGSAPGCLVRSVFGSPTGQTRPFAPSPSAHLGDHTRKNLRVTAHQEIPNAQSPPVVHRHHPPLRGLMLGAVLVVFFAFDFQDKGLSVLEADKVIRLVTMRDALVLVGDQQERPVVAHVASDEVGQLFQAGSRRLLGVLRSPEPPTAMSFRLLPRG